MRSVQKGEAYVHQSTFEQGEGHVHKIDQLGNIYIVRDIQRVCLYKRAEFLRFRLDCAAAEGAVAHQAQEALHVGPTRKHPEHEQIRLQPPVLLVPHALEQLLVERDSTLPALPLGR